MSDNTVKTEPLGLVLRLFHSWNDANVKYCHWKGNEHLLEGMCGETDLDVLMTDSSREEGTRILTELKFIHLSSQFGSSYPHVEDWVGCDPANGKLAHVHLHFQIVSGHHGMKEYTLPFADELISTRINDEHWDVYIAEPTLELLMLYTRIGIKAEYRDLLKAQMGNYHVSKHDIPEILYLKDRYDKDTLNNIAEKYYGDNKHEVLEIISRDTYDSKWLLDLHRIAIKTCKPYNRTGMAQPFLRIYYRLAIAVRRIERKLFLPYMITKKTIPDGKGVIVVFVGQDGAGKSTVTKEAVKWLTWKIDAKRFYYGSGDGYRSINRAIAARLKGKGGATNILRAMLAVSNYRKIAKKHLRLSRAMKRYVDHGAIAICDRYPQIQFEGINDGPKIRNLKKRTSNDLVQRYLDWQAKKEEADIRKTIELCPDLVFKLTLPVEESMRRKPEENEAAIREKNRILDELSFGESKCVIVRADQDFEQELTLIHTNIWDEMILKVTSADSRLGGANV